MVILFCALISLAIGVGAAIASAPKESEEERRERVGTEFNPDDHFKYDEMPSWTATSRGSSLFDWPFSNIW